MTDDRRKRGRAGLEEIDVQLDGLLGKLGETLGDLIERLGNGESSELRRSHEVLTPRGPVRAETGVRIQMGLAETSARGARPAYRSAPAQGSAPARGSAREAHGSSAAPRAAVLDACAQDGRWLLTAELPGVSLPEVSVEVADGAINLETAGARRYAASHALPPGADPTDMELVLRNGILELSIGMTRPEEDAQ